MTLDLSSSDSESEQEGLRPFRYSRLSTVRTIRLLKLQPSSKRDQEVICELVERDLDQADGAEYEALSWNWPTELPNDKIKIRENDEAYTFDVSADLVQALTALRQKRRVRVLWIDAVCIDQRRSEEKNHQVPMMSSIYGKAKKVCIWLGEGDAESKIAIDFIKKEVLKLQSFDELCESQEAAARWRAMLNLMKRKWFSRRWVVQEIALANDAMLYCGTESIRWKDFADAVQLFVEVESATHRLSEVMRKDPNFYHIPGWFDYVSALGASLLVEATGTLFRAAKDDKRQRLLSLEYLVSNLSVFEATVPHDTIYALLAIAKDTAPVAVGAGHSEESAFPAKASLRAWGSRHLQARPYQVDYSQPFVDVCKDFVEFAIRQSARSDPTRALDILCRPWAPNPSRKKTSFARSFDSEKIQWSGAQNELMPSWIPRLSGAAHSMIIHPSGEHRMGRTFADPLVGLPSPGLRSYSAAETREVQMNKLKFKKRREYFSMYVSGFILDEVGKVEVASQAGNIPDSWVEAVGWTNHDQDPPEEFWRTLVADRGRHGRNPPTYYARACKESITKGLETGSLNTQALIDEGRCSVTAEFFRRVQAVIWNRSMMRTKEQYLGIVRREVKEGDLVCIFYGCSVPVILRRHIKKQREVDEERREDELEDEQKVRAAALRILDAYRKSKARKKKALRTQTAPLLGRSQSSPSTIPGNTAPRPLSPIGEHPPKSRPASEGQLKVKPPLKPKPNHIVDTPGSSARSTNGEGISDEYYWYEFVGECYVHGMMDGEAIKHQNQNEIPVKIFELR